MSVNEASSIHTAAAPLPRGDRRAFVVVSVIGILLCLVIIACAPGAGLIIKAYRVSSSSMVPTLEAGHYAVVSRVAYGYSRYSFDWVSLPINGRFPMITPQRGDVIVFKLPRDGQADYIKRVIGLPGEKVQFIKGRLYINGKVVPRQPVAEIKTDDLYGHPAAAPAYRESLRPGEFHTIIEIEKDRGFYDNTKVFDVPPGHYFVLGDNRDRSADSRIPAALGGVGFVPVENVTGEVITSF